MSYIFRFLLLFCGLSLCISAHAQSGKVELYFVSFPKTLVSEPLELLIGENETIEVELPTTHISQAYEVPALSTWALGKSSESEGGEFVFQTFGSAPSAKSGSQLVLVLPSAKGEANALELVALNYTQNGFGGGEYLFINAASVDIGGTIGEQDFVIKPRSHKKVAPKATKTRGDRAYSYAKFYFRNNDTAKAFFSATWRLNDKARSMVFFYHDPRTKQLRLHNIRKFIIEE